jgi:uncharacterized protein (DUF111 family)
MHKCNWIVSIQIPNATTQLWFAFNSSFLKDSKLQHHLQKFNITSFQFYTKIKELQERSIKTLHFNVKILERHNHHCHLNKKMQNIILLTKL